MTSPTTLQSRKPYIIRAGDDDRVMRQGRVRTFNRARQTIRQRPVGSPQYSGNLRIIFAGLQNTALILGSATPEDRWREDPSAFRVP